MPEGISTSYTAPITGLERARNLLGEPTTVYRDIDDNLVQSNTEAGVSLSYPLSGIGDAGLKSHLVFRTVKETPGSFSGFLKRVLENSADAFEEITESIKNIVTDFFDNARGLARDVTEVDAQSTLDAITEKLQSEDLNLSSDEIKKISTEAAEFIKDVVKGGLRDGEGAFKNFIDKIETDIENGAGTNDLDFIDDVPETRNEVKLYMPPAFSYNDGVSYNNFELGVGGAKFEAASKSGSTMGERAKQGFENTFADLGGLLGIGNNSRGADAAFALMAQGVADKFGQGGLAKSMSRVVSNPNVRVIFSGVNLRTFSFTFNLISASAKESKEIEKIVKFFRTELYPISIGQKIGNTQVETGLRFPNRFIIEIMYGGVPVFTKLKPLYLTNVSTVYNKSQAGMHHDGKPFEVDVTLTFQESVALKRQDIENGY